MDYVQPVLHHITTKLQVLNPWILTVVATLLFWFVLSYHNSRAWKVGYDHSAALDEL